MLGGIALKLLTNAFHWTEIFALNRDKLDSPDQIREATELQMPSVAEASLREGG
jgi:nucleoid-associated protein YgaU